MKPIFQSKALIPVLMGFLLSPVVADTPAKASPVVITIELASPKRPITPDSSGVFKITIKNTASFPLYIYKNLEFGTTIFVQNQAKKEIQPRVVGDLCPPPPPRPGEQIWAEIGPGKSVSTLYERSIDDLGISKPGLYYATAYYFRYLTRAPEHNHPSLRESPLKSAPIEFIVQ